MYIQNRSIAAIFASSEVGKTTVTMLRRLGNRTLAAAPLVTEGCLVMMIMCFCSKFICS